jgi:hypothetical protein
MMIAYSMKVSRAHVGRRPPERLALRPYWKALKMHDRTLICVVNLENVFQLESEQRRRAHHRRFRQGIIDQSCRIGNVVLQLSRKLCEANFLAARPMFRRSSNGVRARR